MKAIVHSQYGSPALLRLQEFDRPAVGDHDVLIRVRAAAVNPRDRYVIRGLPYFVRLTGRPRKPKPSVPGTDVAGQVEAVGDKVTRLRPGDDVFGRGQGAFAEFACGRETDLAPKPAGLSFEQAAAIPIAGCTALQALRDHGRLQPGQSVLVNGAAGGVGTFAVQVAAALGGKVTGVCSTVNVDLVRSLGADEVVDYTAEDFTRRQQYDVLLDAVGNRSLSDLRRAVSPGGSVVLCGGGGGPWLGPVTQLLSALVLSRFVRPRMVPFVAHIGSEDLSILAEMIEGGKIRPIIDRIYPLSETGDAVGYVEAGHARGKVVIAV